MIKRVLAVLLVGCCLVVSNGCGKSEDGGAGGKEVGLTFKDFSESLDLVKNTEVAVKDFWERNKEKPVTWTADVVDVKSGRGGRVVITLADKSGLLYRGYNIELESYDEAGSAKLKKGEPVTFTGTPYKYSNRKGRPFLVYLNNGELKLDDAK